MTGFARMILYVSLQRAIFGREFAGRFPVHGIEDRAVSLGRFGKLAAKMLVGAALTRDWTGLAFRCRD
jgi:hypothetical protein